MQEINLKIHHVMSLAPNIECVLAATLRTPFQRKSLTSWFVQRINSYYSRNKDPTQYVTPFNIAMGRANFSDKEKDANFLPTFRRKSLWDSVDLVLQIGQWLSTFSTTYWPSSSNSTSCLLAEEPRHLAYERCHKLPARAFNMSS